ncbi:unnamed protein product [Arabis nemorensis]|uniref:RING-type domain-containing protein n=1 Tax=Arabis nemorensis TaxID=586526 RepID=A0A565B0V3_9BRAS|nr:unnamed protein product [Arabis nemorensis]
MVVDSITDSELFHGSPISRDFVKKRKANWIWKLKQWKIDARKRGNLGEEGNGSRLVKSLRDKLSDRRTGSDPVSYLHQACRIDHEEGSFKFTKCDDDDDETDLEVTSSMSASSPTSVLKNKDDSGSNNSGEDDDCFCCSKQMVEEEEEGYDDAFDNWDGFKDAFNSFENEDNKGSAAALHETKTEEVPKPNTNQRRRKSSPAKLYHKDKYFKQKPSPEKAIQKNRRKKKKSDQQQDCDEKSECPICSEEMDATDLSFLPCPCGFQLCLFCHKQINENDGRCPACRKKYETSNNSGEVGFQQRGRGTIRLSPSFRGLDRA